MRQQRTQCQTQHCEPGLMRVKQYYPDHDAAADVILMKYLYLTPLTIASSKLNKDTSDTCNMFSVENINQKLIYVAVFTLIRNLQIDTKQR